MKKISLPIYLLVIMIASFSHAATGTATSENQIVVLSYNIHHGEGEDKRFDLERIAEVIKSVSPDVVALQEVDNKTRRSKGVDQAEELARLTKMQSIFGASMDFDGGKYGNAVLTRLTVESFQTIPLPGEPRSALCVFLRKSQSGKSDMRFLFMATHLDTQQEPRLRSVPLIEQLFASNENTPALLAGDLNATPESETMQALLKTWSNATRTQGLYTFPVGSPSRQIDYILCRPQRRWKVVEAKVLEEAVASDHRPIVAVLVWQPIEGSETGN